MRSVKWREGGSKQVRDRVCLWESCPAGVAVKDLSEFKFSGFRRFIGQSIGKVSGELGGQLEVSLEEGGIGVDLVKSHVWRWEKAQVFFRHFRSEKKNAR